MNSLLQGNTPQGQAVFLGPSGGSSGGQGQVGQGGVSIEGRAIHGYYVQQMLQLIEIINQSQAENNLRSLIYFIQMEGQLSKQVVQRACSLGSGREWEQAEQTEHTRERCGKIKTRNIRILGRLMNLRLKLVKNMNMYKSRSHQREVEIGHINQKIRSVQSQITLKYNRLQALRVIKQGKAPPQPESSVPSNIPFAELRRGVEVLEKETIKLRQEMSLLQKYMHKGSI